MEHMITVIRTGSYRLLETPHAAKFLVLNNKNIFAWLYSHQLPKSSAGELLLCDKNDCSNCVNAAVGKYRLYTVKDEPGFTDYMHLELLIEKGRWEGYLLPAGLPTHKEKRKRIIPTEEQITCSSAHCDSAQNSAFSNSLIS